MNHCFVPLRALLVGIALLLLAPEFAFSQTEQTAEQAIEAIRKKSGCVGLMGGVFYSDGTCRVDSSGIVKSGSDVQIQPTDLMHLGSCTKSMTATLIGMLVDEGKLDWNSTIGDVFSDVPEVVSSRWAGVTVDSLLHHTSQAPANANWGDFGKGGAPLNEQRLAVLKWLCKQPRKSDKAEGAFLYSNTGYVILGAMLEKKLGGTWEEIIQKNLFVPLSMSSAGFGPPTKASSEARVYGHRTLFGIHTPVENDNPPVLGPAGTVHASLSDWAKYLALHLRKAEPGSVPFVSQASLDHLHTASPGQSYAGGWGTGERPWAGGPILTHNGSNTHWYCVVFLAPEKGFGVFAASNTGLDSSKPCDEILQWMIRNNPGPKNPSKP